MNRHQTFHLLERHQAVEYGLLPLGASRDKVHRFLPTSGRQDVFAAITKILTGNNQANLIDGRATLEFAQRVGK